MAWHIKLSPVLLFLLFAPTTDSFSVQHNVFSFPKKSSLVQRQFAPFFSVKRSKYFANALSSEKPYQQQSGAGSTDTTVKTESEAPASMKNAESSEDLIRQAIVRCRQAIASNTSNEEPLYYLGVLLLQCGGEEAEALDAFLRAAVLRPDREDTWLRIAGLHEAAGRPGFAAPAYLSALRAAPNSWRALTGLGALLERGGGDGGDAAALQAYARAAELAPAAAEPAHVGAVRLLRRAGRAEDARAAAARYLAAAPDSAAALCAVGACLQAPSRPPLRPVRPPRPGAPARPPVRPFAPPSLSRTVRPVASRAPLRPSVRPSDPLVPSACVR
jgi:tetratricopeptide (TPR) repeat protein